MTTLTAASAQELEETISIPVTHFVDIKEHLATHERIRIAESASTTTIKVDQSFQSFQESGTLRLLLLQRTKIFLSSFQYHQSVRDKILKSSSIKMSLKISILSLLTISAYAIPTELAPLDTRMDPDQATSILRSVNETIDTRDLLPRDGSCNRSGCVA